MDNNLKSQLQDKLAEAAAHIAVELIAVAAEIAIQQIQEFAESHKPKQGG